MKRRVVFVWCSVVPFITIKFIQLHWALVSSVYKTHDSLMKAKLRYADIR